MKRQTIDSLLTKAVVVLSGLILLSWALIAIAHVNDRYRVDHEAGAWMALARSVAEGTLYPPLVEDGVYGGTRWMPLQIVATGGFAWVTGEELVSGKLFAYGVFAVLLALVFLGLRQQRCPLPLAVGLSSVLLVTGSGLLAATSIYGDALSVAFQVGALILILRKPSPGWAAAAGTLCALAWLSKTSALWGAAAIFIWLVVRHRRSALPFSAAAILVSVVGWEGFNLISRGRMYDNLVELSASGFTGPGRIFIHSPLRLGRLFLDHAPAFSLLVGLAVVAIVIGLRQRRLTLYQLALLASGAVLIVILADYGTDWNHLLDMQVATVLVVGELYVMAEAMSRGPGLRTGLTAILVVVLLSGYFATLAGDTRDAVRVLGGEGRDASTEKYPLAGLVTRNDVLLSEDPTIPVLLDQTPIVLDSFMLLRLDRDHPQRTEELVRRIEQKAFSKVVLTRELDVSDDWWRTNHFGPRIIRSIADNYGLRAKVDRYWVYQPR
jgi:hypothetical protein